MTSSEINAQLLEEECRDGDLILALFPELQRTEGGRLPAAEIVNAICDLSARLKNAEQKHKTWQQIADQRAIEVADLQVEIKRLNAGAPDEHE